MGLFDRPEKANGSIKELHGRVFYLESASLREGIKTKFGENTAIDLTVVERDPDDDKKACRLVFSGFSAGLVQQVRRSTQDDFPCFASIEIVPLRNGNHTTELVPHPKEDHTPLSADEVREILAREDEDDSGSDSPPHSDDDIPF